MKLKEYYELKAKHARLKFVLRLIFVLFLAFVITIVTIVIPTEHAKKQYYKTHATMEQKKANKILARKIAWAGYGWRDVQWDCARRLFIKESRFDHLAKNKKSTAFGIGQVLSEKSKDPMIQLLRAYNYIETRYQNPCRAYYHHQRRNWY